MSEADEPTKRRNPPDEPEEPEWKRKQRLARIFGDVLPETTSDERESSAESEESASDRWLKSQVPPHHGG